MLRNANESLSFWNFIYKKLGCEIPKYLVNILTLQGFDNVLSVMEMVEEDLIQMESYVKSDKFDNRIPADADRRDFYGTFHATKAEFEIIPGHRKLLYGIVNYVKTTWKVRGPKFFEMCSTSADLSTAKNVKKFSSHCESTVLIGTSEMRSSIQVQQLPSDFSTDSNFQTADESLMYENFDQSRDQRIDENISMNPLSHSDDEECILFDKTIKWMKSNYPGWFFEFPEKLNHRMLSVDIGDRKATVLCPICDSLLTVHKTGRILQNGKNGKENWNISNYSRHVTKCNSERSNGNVGKQATTGKKSKKSTTVKRENDADDDDDFYVKRPRKPIDVKKEYKNE